MLGVQKEQSEEVTITENKGRDYGEGKKEGKKRSSVKYMNLNEQIMTITRKSLYENLCNTNN
jgi:hypothetical protein